MAISHRDIFRSIAKEFAASVAPIPVFDASVSESTSNRSTWLDIDILSFEPTQTQRNTDFEGRGTIRIRGYYREQPGQTTKPGQPLSTTDERFRLTQAAQVGLRGKNIQVYDHESGTGANLLAAVMIGEVPCSTLEPTGGVGMILANVEFLLTTA